MGNRFTSSDGADLRDKLEDDIREVRDMIQGHIAAPAHDAAIARLDAIEKQLVHRRDDADDRFGQVFQLIRELRADLSRRPGGN